jgi:hypothetical protein
MKDKNFIFSLIIGFIAGMISSMVGFSITDWEHWVIVIPFILFSYPVVTELKS